MASTKTSRVQALDDDEIGAHPGEDLEAQGEALTGNEALAIAITDVAADATDLDLDPPDTEDTRTEVAESKKKPPPRVLISKCACAATFCGIFSGYHLYRVFQNLFLFLCL